MKKPANDNIPERLRPLDNLVQKYLSSAWGKLELFTNMVKS